MYGIRNRFALYSFLTLIAFPAYAHSQHDSLTILNWEDYLSPHLIEQWREKTGQGIHQIYIDNDNKRDSILTSSGQKIDIAVVDELGSAHFGSKGQFIELNEANVPNLKHMGSFWRNRCGKHAVPYFWGTLGIIYRTDKVTEKPRQWSNILHPIDALHGHISMLDDPTDLLAPALFHLNHSINSGSQTELKQVFDLLVTQADSVLTYEYPITFLETSPNADKLHMAVAYGGDQNVINDNLGKPNLWQYSVPEEGTILWVDCLAVLSTSHNKDEALEFINFLSTPQVSAEHSMAIGFATPNETAKALLPLDIMSNEDLYPSQDVIARSALYQPLSKENLELRTRITNSVMYIYEAGKTR